MKSAIKVKGGRLSALRHARAQRPHKLSKPARKAVAKIAKRVVNSKAETKMVTFFNGTIANPSPIRNSTGTFNDAGPVSQNQFISSNTTDILKLIPDIAQGNADNNRNGRFVNPVSAVVHCKVMLSPTSTGATGWQSIYATAYDLTFVAYLLQSVTYKTYSALAAGNDFTKMLDVGDGTTTNFDGSFSAANLPIEKGYYRCLAMKRKQLRSSGIFTGTGGAVNYPTNNNSANLVHEWKWNLTKHLPKKLIYPEETVTVANGLNEPLNSSLFWCVGYYNTDGTVLTTGVINIQQEYTSILKFKDF